jgi:hypothetical protein
VIYIDIIHVLIIIINYIYDSSSFSATVMYTLCCHYKYIECDSVFYMSAKHINIIYMYNISTYTAFIISTMTTLYIEIGLLSTG